MTRIGARALAAMAVVIAGCWRPTPPAPPTPARVPASASSSADSAPGATRAIASEPTPPPPPTRPSAAEIVREAQAMFGDSVLAALAGDSTLGAESDAPTWDIDVRSYETHQRVEHFVSVYTGRARESFVRGLARGSRYEATIREKLRAAGMPEDLYYLAFVESGYDPNAYSSAAAVGMWQFMATTARGTGLRVDWWIDERRDPVRSTDAAIKFLDWLRDEFGSMYLAAAAYNGGPGRVARGLTRFASDLEGTVGDDRFFALAEKDYLPRDTKDYVPQIIAAALVAKEPERYGLTLRTLPPFEYDSVWVPAATPLAAVAAAAAATVDEIAELNTHVLRGTTPPGGRFMIRIPAGRAATFDSAFAALDPTERAAFWRVVTKKGQTIGSIAAREKVTARQLRMFNPRLSTLKSGALRAGQSVLVPSRSVLAAARDVPDPSIEIYGRSTRAAARVHVVKRGETLSGIARRYGTTVATLKRLNGLKRDRIRIGQSLTVRAGAARARSTARPASRSAQTKKASSRSATSKSATSRSKNAASKRAAAKPTSAKRATPEGATPKRATAKRGSSGGTR